MERPEISLMKYEDIDTVREMQAVVWQDYFLKEKMREVPLMLRSRQNLKYYMEKEPDGFFLARVGGDIVGSIICHRWGRIGWFGPFEVRPEYQNKGIGKMLTMRTTEYLKAAGCTTIGLETMTTSSRNVAFYSKLGFEPKQLSYVLYKDLTNLRAQEFDLPCRSIEPNSDLAGLKERWNDIVPGLDYSCELESTIKHGLGEAIIVNEPDWKAHLLFHAYDLIEGSNTAIVKLLVSDIGPEMKHLALFDWCENRAVELGKIGMFIRFYSGSRVELKSLLDRGYRLTGTLIRMQLTGPDENSKLAHVSSWSG